MRTFAEPERIDRRVSCLVMLAISITLWIGIGFGLSYLLGLLPSGSVPKLPH